MTGGRGGAIIFFDCRAAGSHYVYMDSRLRWGCMIQPKRPGFQDFWNSVSFGCSRTPENEIPDDFLHFDARKFCIRGFFFFFCYSQMYNSVLPQVVVPPSDGTCRRPLVEAAAGIKNANVSFSCFFPSSSSSIIGLSSLLFPQ